MGDQDLQIDLLHEQGFRRSNSGSYSPTERLKEYLCSDAIPKLTKSEHLVVQSADNFIESTTCLLSGLR